MSRDKVASFLQSFSFLIKAENTTAENVASKFHGLRVESLACDPLHSAGYAVARRCSGGSGYKGSSGGKPGNAGVAGAAGKTGDSGEGGDINIFPFSSEG